MTSPAARARSRGVREVVHFTTDLGLLGIMTVGAVIPRKQLQDHQLLEFILKVNAARRWDHPWLDYVNLSVSRINLEFFGHSDRWHAGELGRWWTVLSFDPDILDHDGVWFSTTNNGYPATTRAQGTEGFETLFAPVVLGKYGSEIRRATATPDKFTTDPQAEVLYPGTLSLSFLRRVYVMEEDHGHYFESLCSNNRDLLGLSEVNPAVFGYAS